MTRTTIGSVFRLLPLTVAVGACTLFFDSPTVRIVDVRLTGIGLRGATAEIVLEVANPNGVSLTSTAIEYTLAFENPAQAPSEEAPEASRWQVLTEGRSNEVVTVEAEGSSELNVSAPFRYEDLGRAFVSLLEEGGLRYRLSGEVTFDAPIGEVRVPFEDTGDIGR